MFFDMKLFLKRWIKNFPSASVSIICSSVIYRGLLSFYLLPYHTAVINVNIYFVGAPGALKHPGSTPRTLFISSEVLLRKQQRKLVVVQQNKLVLVYTAHRRSSTFSSTQSPRIRAAYSSGLAEACTRAPRAAPAGTQTDNTPPPTLGIFIFYIFS